MQLNAVHMHGEIILMVNLVAIQLHAVWLRVSIRLNQLYG